MSGKRSSIISLLFAALMICCFSCKDTNNKPDEKGIDSAVEDISEENTQNENEDSSSAEDSSPVKPAEFRELTDADFKDISINWKYTDEKAPFKAQLYDLSDIDLGEADMSPVQSGDSAIEAALNEAMRELESEDSDNNRITSYHYYKGCLYLRILSAGNASGSYADTSWSLIRYELNSGKKEEVYRWTASSENEYCRENPRFVDNELFFIVMNDNECNVDILDIESGNVRRVFSKSASNGFLFKSSGCISLRINNNNSENLYSYNMKTDTFEKARFTTYSSTPNEDIKFFFKNDIYSFVTDADYFRMLYCDDKTFILTNGYQIHFYDIEKMEHCVMFTTSIGGTPSFYDGYVFLGGDGIYCLKPELGIVYTVFKGKDGESYSQESFDPVIVEDGGLMFMVLQEETHKYNAVCVVQAE